MSKNGWFHSHDQNFDLETKAPRKIDYYRHTELPDNKKKKSVVRWDLEGPLSSGYLDHCSHPFFKSIRIEFLASYSTLSQSLLTPTSLTRLFINPEFCQCPLKRSYRLQLF